jgi:hypothetical protein
MHPVSTVLACGLLHFNVFRIRDGIVQPLNHSDSFMMKVSRGHQVGRRLHTLSWDGTAIYPSLQLLCVHSHCAALSDWPIGCNQWFKKATQAAARCVRLGILQYLPATDAVVLASLHVS